MRDDLLAKRLFYGGCLGLPWLWIVHLLYWWGKQRRDNQENRDEGNPEALLNHTEREEEYADESNEAVLSAEQIKLEAKRWVDRSLYGAIIVCSLWVAWVIAFQVCSEKFGAGWFVMSEDEAESTGW